MSRKGEAKKRKAERLRNKKLIERYPWISPVDWHWKRIPSYDFTMYDDVPKGWKRAFGKISQIWNLNMIIFPVIFVSNAVV